MPGKQPPWGGGRLLYGGITDAHTDHPSCSVHPLKQQLERIQLFEGMQGVAGLSAKNYAMKSRIPLFTLLPRRLVFSETRMPQRGSSETQSHEKSRGCKTPARIVNAPTKGPLGAFLPLRSTRAGSGVGADGAADQVRDNIGPRHVDRVTARSLDNSRTRPL